MFPGSDATPDTGAPAPPDAPRTALVRLRRRCGWLTRRWWPSRCLLCEQPVAARLGAGNAGLCDPCHRALPGAGRDRCAVCAAPSRPATACADCARLAPAFSRTLAAADYCSPLADALVALKFGGRIELAAGCGGLLAAALAEQPGPVDGVEALVPVPLAPARLIERGFNQAALIADTLHAQWPLPGRAPPLQRRWLARQRDTRRQTGLGGNQRRHNLQHGFVAGRGAAGRIVAVVDDVMTTGATLDAAARALRSAGARDVVALVVARTP